MMTKNRRRRIKNAKRRAGEKPRPIPVLIRVEFIFSMCSILVFAAAILAALKLNVETTRFFGAIGSLLMLLGILLAVLELKKIKKDKETFVVRLISVIFAFVSVAAWSAVYIMGIIHS